MPRRSPASKERQPERSLLEQTRNVRKQQSGPNGHRALSPVLASSLCNVSARNKNNLPVRADPRCLVSPPGIVAAVLLCKLNAASLAAIRLWAHVCGWKERLARLRGIKRWAPSVAGGGGDVG